MRRTEARMIDPLKGHERLAQRAYGVKSPREIDEDVRAAFNETRVPAADRPRITGGLSDGMGLLALLDALERLGIVTNEVDVDPIGTPTYALSGIPIDVRDFGLVGDDATDNTDAMQAMFDALRTNTLGGRRIYFPGNPDGERATYRISDEIVVDCGNHEVFGAGVNATRIKQMTANKTIFRWNHGDGNSGVTGIPQHMYWHDLEAMHDALATSSDTQQWGFQFRPYPDGTDGPGSPGQGYYFNQFARLRIRNCYIGWGDYIASSSYRCPMWGTSFEDVVFYGMKQSAIKIDGGTSGSPNNVFRGVNIVNFENNPASADPSIGPALDLNIAQGAYFHGLNVEDWDGRLINLQASKGVTIDGFRVERHRASGAAPVIVLVNGSETHLTVSGLDYTFGVLDNTTDGRFFTADSGATVILNGANMTRSSGTGEMAILAGVSGAARIVANGMYFGAGFKESVPGGTTQWARHGVDGRPPEVDTLPTAAAYYRGRLFRVLGGAGVADATYLCEKLAGGTYQWRAL